ncbi:predicted protein [Plenodomus lingam JN3]|uniref:Predicted protein n=1 Tax=Leptosphaeria maculans (strain JN3 / isolate v23.1.3 / race Av1-4-5-6-7-8) TaxID=985895 RepID=E4ZYH4_LEPMJ|nr:predicted protein [Plenodomus lingam JN3]CBX96500.1 predicted protein [Plenodomus lingam JN3]
MGATYGITFGGLFATVLQIGSTFFPARPAALPLAVKSAYFSAWLPAGSNDNKGGYLPGRWPTFWTYTHAYSRQCWPELFLCRRQYLGWTGLIEFDGKALTWMGAPS